MKKLSFIFLIFPIVLFAQSKDSTVTIDKQLVYTNQQIEKVTTELNIHIGVKLFLEQLKKQGYEIVKLDSLKAIKEIK